ncbi:MAG: hypothetical protein IMW97_08395 [Firmicutes bacterium]|nr:hypothetical protein [Candidatus Fermentithermobacillaceae bacterium]
MTNIDDDHLDYCGSVENLEQFSRFARGVGEGG